MELKVWRIFVACDISGMKMAVSSAYVRSVKWYWPTSMPKYMTSNYCKWSLNRLEENAHQNTLLSLINVKFFESCFSWIIVGSHTTYTLALLSTNNRPSG